MPAKIIDGAAIAAAIKDEAKKEAALLKERSDVVPGLAFLIVGNNPGSVSYVRSKEKACAYCGYHSTTVSLPATASQTDVLEQIDSWNVDTEIHGILVQLPLPPHIDENIIINAIYPAKDVDGFHPVNVGKLVIGQECLRPCTPAGIQELILRSGIETKGKHVVVAGRSNIVGKPIANIMLQKSAGANSVVTIVHTAASDIGEYTRQADILIVAIGRPGAVTGEMVKEGVAVIDVGINRVEDATAPRGYRLVGDVDFESVSLKASAISPVPGGVGPMTIAMLMKNTLAAAKRKVKQ
jgi:methylenetetrahydrofolate dehydrogenase (NADP+) / methenyltetrahydrofolate cyclohydrolase